MGEFVKRAVDSLKKVRQAACPPDEEFKTEYPAIWDFLTCDKHSDGKARQRSTLTVFADAGTWKASLNDRDAKASGFVASDSFLGVLKALEEALADGTLDWRTWQANGFSRQGKK